MGCAVEVPILICLLLLFPSLKTLNNDPSHTSAADFRDDGAVGSGVRHRGPRAGAGHVRAAAPAVRRHRGPGAGSAQDLHHQRRLRGGHHQPAGLPRADPLSAERQDGQRGGEAHDSWIRVRLIITTFGLIVSS